MLNLETASSGPIVLIMAKSPQAGRVKTRLLPFLSPDEAAALAACFVQDVVAGALSLTPNVLVAYAPAEGRATLEALLPSDLLWALQEGSDLGARMQSVLEAASRQGFSPLIMLGTDSPTLPQVYLSDAVELLESRKAEVVLGPTDDGGYYLIGLPQPLPGLLANVAWSTPNALTDTLRNAAALGRRTSLLPPWYDVDTPNDFQRLQAEFSVNPAIGKRAPQTYYWINRHQNRPQ